MIVNIGQLCVGEFAQAEFMDMVTVGRIERIEYRDLYGNKQPIKKISLSALKDNDFIIYFKDGPSVISSTLTHKFYEGRNHYVKLELGTGKREKIRRDSRGNRPIEAKTR